MQSMLLAKLNLDLNKITESINIINTMQFDDAYQEYSIGIWKTKTLWNKTGIDSDSLSEEYIGSALQTPSAKQLPYINKIIEENFNSQFIKSVRIFHSSSGGLIVPHRDYMEFKKGFKRFHLVISTDTTCLNSEENVVYHMRQGEFWFLEGHRTHSATSFSESGKYTLVIDFDPSVELNMIFKKDNNFQFNDLKPFIIENRQRPEPALMASLLKLSTIISPYNFSSIFHLLCKLHFEYSISGDEVYFLLHDLAMESKRIDVINLYQKVKAIFRTHGPQYMQKSA